MWPLTISPYDSYDLVNLTSWGFSSSTHASSSDFFPNWNSPQPLASGELVFNKLSLSLIISPGKCSLTLFSLNKFMCLHCPSLGFVFTPIKTTPFYLGFTSWLYILSPSLGLKIWKERLYLKLSGSVSQEPSSMYSTWWEVNLGLSK